MKRKERDPNDIEDFDLSRSDLHHLEAAEGIQDDLDRIQRDVDSTRDVQQGVGFDAAQIDTTASIQEDLASLDLDKARLDIHEARVSLEDMRITLDDFRPGLINNMLPSTNEVLKGRVESIRSSLYKPPALLRSDVFKGFAKPTIPSHLSQIMVTGSGTQDIFRSLSRITVGPSPVLPATSRARIFDMTRGAAASEAARNRQGVYSMLETVNSSFSQSLADQIRVANPFADLGRAVHAMNNSIAATVHGMDARLLASWRRMILTDINTIYRQVNSGILGILPQLDWEALERYARIEEARRPRTPIGFAARDAYDAFYLNQPWIVDRFLRERLSIEPNEDRQEALWRVLRWTFERTIPEPVKWLLMEDEEQAVRYLRAAVYKNERRVRTAKERPDRVWWEEREPESKKMIELPSPTRQPPDVMELMMRRAWEPEELIVSQLDPRLESVLELLFVEGTEQDRKVVVMIRAGLDLPDIADLVGWSEVQRFTRKAERRGKKLIPRGDG